MIPEAAVEAAARAMVPLAWGPSVWQLAAHGETPTAARDRARRESLEQARTALEAAAPHMAAQALTDAVDAFPLETITAPDTAVVWLMRRAEQLEAR